ncbi:MAG: tetratricopeptide repeat protein [Alkalimonas sp.]|nr:tetratricopeptide repeat protein [Alkalimonas sp.]
MVKSSKITLVALSIYALSACSSPPPSVSSTDIIEVKKRAENAYQLALFDQAETLYLEILREVPNYAPALFRLGNIYSRTGRLDAAVNAYHQNLAIEPENHRAMYNLALVRLRQAHQITEVAMRYKSIEPNINLEIQRLHRALSNLSQYREEDLN